MELQVGSVEKPRVFEAYVALCRVQGDNPYLAKLSNTLSASSYYACKWCHCVGSTQLAAPDGNGLEALRATRMGGYHPELPTIVYALKQTPAGIWVWVKIENHCLQNPDGTLNTAGGLLLVTNAAHHQRAQLAELHGQQAADAAARKHSNGAALYPGLSWM
jgi:hypothetical protein